MGNEGSTIPLQPVPKDFGYMCVIFKIPDNIRIIHGTQTEHSIIEHSIKSIWEEGIQATKMKCSGSVLCHKLNGLPFETGILSMNVRDMACEILQELNNIGWQLIVSTNLTKCREWFSLIFAHKKAQRLSCKLAYMSLSSTDKLLFRNLQQNTLDEVSKVLSLDYAPGIHSEEKSGDGKSYDVFLMGSPWSSKASYPAEARAILMRIFTVFTKRYNFLCVMNIKRTQDTFVFHPKPTPNPSPPQCFIISLRKTSKLQVFGAPEELHSIIYDAISEVLGRGNSVVSKTTDHYTGTVQFEYKCLNAQRANYPTIQTKNIISTLLETLKAHGWSITTGFDMSRGLSNKCELLFHRSSLVHDCKVFCLSPHNSSLFLINAPQSIIAACRDVITSRWHLPLKSETECYGQTPYVGFHLGGHPWSDSADGPYFSHSMLCYLLHEFFHEGYRVILTADVIPSSIGYDEGTSCSHDPSSWWFMHEPTEEELSTFGTEDCTSATTEFKSDMQDVPSLSDALADDYRQPPVVDELAHSHESITEESEHEELPPSYDMATKDI